jgi:hypothetical protein
MNEIELALDWSEAWALLIPLTVLFIKRQPVLNKPIVIYCLLAFLVNTAADIIANCEIALKFPSYLQRNSFLYNIHSIIRFICFATFFNNLRQPYFEKAKKLIPLVSIPIIIVYFLIFESFNNEDHISAYFLAAESFILLVYCIQYYLFLMKEDSLYNKREHHFWIVTGLCLYVVINFFVFLFYIPVLNRNYDAALRLWNIHNIAYVLLCIFLAKAFYVSSRN